jgi:Ribbon-helix-helix protein, copG family
MAKSTIKVKPKKRGRPATGKDPLYGVRLGAELILAVDRWCEENELPSRSEAIRRLLELGLSFSAKVPKVKN